MRTKQQSKATKEGYADGLQFFRERNRDECEQCLEPGQLGADEALINSLGYEKAARLLGVRLRQDGSQSDAFRRACIEYNAAFNRALADALAKGGES